MLRHITILAGMSKAGVKEDFFEITLKAGETVSIVGPTGSGKTAFINDIELLAQGDTATKRRVVINDKIPGEEVRYNPAMKPITMITQNTKCFTDLSVEEFLSIHARARRIESKPLITDTINLANNFTGEKINKKDRVTTLSGGQTRAFLIADAIFIGAAPIILLDEVENAGIFKHEVVKVIRSTGRIIVFVTHDPVIALNTQRRIVMQNGAVKKVIIQSEVERNAAKSLVELDQLLGTIREELRAGNLITEKMANYKNA
jgi:ABC-type lipoprotein export system ATPase subunit